jgi:hypothetical protein
MSPVNVGVSEGCQEQDGPWAIRPQQAPQQSEGRMIGPMDVIEHEQQRPFRTRPLDEAVDGIEKPRALGLRIGARLRS